MTSDHFRHAADWDFPVPIRYGPGRLREIGVLCRGKGCGNPLIVTDRATARLPFVDALRDHLAGAGLRHGSFTDVSPNPTDIEVRAGKVVFLAGGHDSIIALGGGSGMDAGKAISLVLNTDRDLWDFDYNLPRRPNLPKPTSSRFCACRPPRAPGPRRKAPQWSPTQSGGSRAASGIRRKSPLPPCWTRN